MADSTIRKPGADLTAQERETKQRALHRVLLKAAFDWLRDEHGFEPVVIGKDESGEDITAVASMTPEANGDMVIVFANVMGTMIGGADPVYIESMFSQAIDAAREAIVARPQLSTTH